jgi:hypothetical protein
MYWAQTVSQNTKFNGQFEFDETLGKDIILYIILVYNILDSRAGTTNFYRFTPKTTQWVLFELVSKKSLSAWDF